MTTAELNTSPPRCIDVHPHVLLSTEELYDLAFKEDYKKVPTPQYEIILCMLRQRFANTLQYLETL